jgi:hypothetical protein
VSAALRLCRCHASYGLCAACAGLAPPCLIDVGPEGARRLAEARCGDWTVTAYEHFCTTYRRVEYRVRAVHVGGNTLGGPVDHRSERAALAEYERLISVIDWPPVARVPEL